MRQNRRRRNSTAEPGRGSVPAADAAMQYPLMTKKSITPTQHLPAAASSQSAAVPRPASSRSAAPGSATYPHAEWKTMTSQQATPRQASSESYRGGRGSGVMNDLGVVQHNR